MANRVTTSSRVIYDPVGTCMLLMLSALQRGETPYLACQLACQTLHESGAFDPVEPEPEPEFDEPLEIGPVSVGYDMGGRRVACLAHDGEQTPERGG